jgi:phosphatidylglycerophosphate synthase
MGARLAVASSTVGSPWNPGPGMRLVSDADHHPGSRWVPPWLPNLISALRVALVPVFLIVAGECQAAGRAGEDTAPTRAIAIAVLAVICASDLLDGYLARHFGLTSSTGAFLDAFADKFTQVALLLFYTLSDGPAFVSVPVWFFALVFGRDLLLGIGWLIINHLQGKVDVSHHFSGRLATALIFVLLFWIVAGLPGLWAEEAFLIVAAVVAINAAAYVKDGFIEGSAPRAG